MLILSLTQIHTALCAFVWIGVRLVRVKPIVPPIQSERQQPDVDPVSRVMFYAMVVLIAFSIAQTFWGTIVQKDFSIINDLDVVEGSDFELL